MLQYVCKSEPQCNLVTFPPIEPRRVGALLVISVPLCVKFFDCLCGEKATDLIKEESIREREKKINGYNNGIYLARTP